MSARRSEIGLRLEVGLVVQAEVGYRHYYGTGAELPTVGIFVSTTLIPVYLHGTNRIGSGVQLSANPAYNIIRREVYVVTYTYGKEVNQT